MSHSILPKRKLEDWELRADFEEFVLLNDRLTLSVSKTLMQLNFSKLKAFSDSAYNSTRMQASNWIKNTLWPVSVEQAELAINFSNYLLFDCFSNSNEHTEINFNELNTLISLCVSLSSRFLISSKQPTFSNLEQALNKEIEEKKLENQNNEAIKRSSSESAPYCNNKEILLKKRKFQSFDEDDLTDTDTNSILSSPPSSHNKNINSSNSSISSINSNCEATNNVNSIKINNTSLSTPIMATTLSESFLSIEKNICQIRTWEFPLLRNLNCNKLEKEIVMKILKNQNSELSSIVAPLSSPIYLTSCNYLLNFFNYLEIQENLINSAVLYSESNDEINSSQPTRKSYIDYTPPILNGVDINDLLKLSKNINRLTWKNLSKNIKQEIYELSLKICLEFNTNAYNLLFAPFTIAISSFYIALSNHPLKLDRNLIQLIPDRFLRPNPYKLLKLYGVNLNNEQNELIQDIKNYTSIHICSCILHQHSQESINNFYYTK